jgi:hypothetical protein
MTVSGIHDFAEQQRTTLHNVETKKCRQKISITIFRGQQLIEAFIDTRPLQEFAQG